MKFRSALDWSSEAHRLASLVEAPARPIVVSHLGRTAIIGPAAHVRMKRLGEALAAGAEKILGSAEAHGIAVVIIAANDPTEAIFYVSPSGQRMCLSTN